jgi:hypothetical protein
MEKESKCPRGVYKVKTYGTLQLKKVLIRKVVDDLSGSNCVYSALLQKNYAEAREI